MLKKVKGSKKSKMEKVIFENRFPFFFPLLFRFLFSFFSVLCCLCRNNFSFFDSFFSPELLLFSFSTCSLSMIFFQLKIFPFLPFSYIVFLLGERERRIKESQSVHAEIHDATLDQIKNAEEEERKRRLQDHP